MVVKRQEVGTHNNWNYHLISKNTLLNFYLKMISLTFIRSISRTNHTKAISAFSGNFTNPTANLRNDNLVATEVGDPDKFLFNPNRNDFVNSNRND